MAEAVVSVALETLRDLLLEEGRFLSGVGIEVKALETQLKEMKCLLEDADKRQHESKTVANWIMEIRDLAYRAEDAVETYAAQVSTKRGRGLKNILGRSSCIIKEFHSLHHLGSEISQIKSDLERVSKSMRDYGLRSIIQGESSTTSDVSQQWKRKTFPHFQIEDCFVGKDDELKHIVSLLLDDDQHRVVSIWGMGGLGKTTIAKKAYNHVDTKRHFQSFAWVCITQQCEIRSVLEDVLNQLSPNSLKRDVIRSLSNIELIEEMCQIQKAKRCIIVLDDLWETDHWDDGLKHAFIVEGLKSKILVTTRKNSVAGIGCSIQLGLLSMESGWELLKKKAFPGTSIPDFTFDDEKKLRKIGNEMVKRCGFLPLKIYLLGGVLSKRKSMREWELVKENMNAYLHRNDDIEKENEIEAVLNLSYEDLPYYLKPCFLYLGLFKEDKPVRTQYTYMSWIAQGMISTAHKHDDESLMVIAELYLNELASRSIVEVEVVGEDSKPGNKYTWCKLHDVVRELCLSVAKREGFGVQTLYFKGGKLLHDSSLSGVKTRHLAVYFDGKFKAEFDKETCKNARSLLLFNVGVENIEFIDIGIDLKEFKLLRGLTFYRLKFEKRKVPKRIGKLIHLRYMGFKRCELDELPSTIRNLSYLQTLDVALSPNVRVPNVLKELLRLKHLMLPTYPYPGVLVHRVEYYALELGEGLDELETLRGFDSLVHQLKSIARLNNLQTFGAKVRDNESLLAVIDSITTKWNKLGSCSIDIEEGCRFISVTEGGVMDMKKVLSCPNLNHLSIRVEIGKQLEECRSCLSRSTIVSLYLWDCKIEDDPMDILGKLPSLRELYLGREAYVGEEMRCHALSFPRLKELKLYRLPRLREWRVEEGAMPLLSEILIIDCQDLTKLPEGLRFISTLQKLTIKWMPTLGERVLAPGEDFDKVQHVPSIIVE